MIAVTRTAFNFFLRACETFHRRRSLAEQRFNELEWPDGESRIVW